MSLLKIGFLLTAASLFICGTSATAGAGEAPTGASAALGAPVESALPDAAQESTQSRAAILDAKLAAAKIAWEKTLAERAAAAAQASADAAKAAAAAQAASRSLAGAKTP